MKKNLDLFIAIILLAVLFGFYYFLNTKVANDTAEKVKFSSAFTENAEISLIVDVAKEKGFFKKNGLEVEKVDSKSSAEALMAGESDVAILPVPSVMAGFFNDQDFKWLATTNSYVSSYHAVSRYPIERLSEVKNVAIMKVGNAEQAAWLKILEKSGHKDLGNVNFVPAPDSKTKFALLDKGEIDVTFIISYEALDKIRKENKYTVIKASELFGGNIQMPLGVVSLGKKVNERPETLRAVVKSINQAIKYIGSHRDEMIAFVKEEYRFSEDNASALYENTQKSREGLIFVPETSAIEEMAQFIRINGKTKNPSRGLNDLIFVDFAKGL